MSLNTYLEKTIEIAQQAGEKIAAIYHQQTEISHVKKQDASFLTEADLQAQDLILRELKKLAPGIPVISEESQAPSFQERQHWNQHWSIDPLDGTYEFVNRSGEFVVSIALIENHYPILGVLHAPLEGVTYYAAKNLGAFKIDRESKIQKIQVNTLNQQDTICITMSRRKEHLPELTQFLAQFPQHTIIKHSSAFKFGLIAEGKADIYPRFGHTNEWDIAAGQCIVEEAGGQVLTLTGERMSYNKQESLTNPYFIALGRLNWALKF